ncbi:MAG: hypothetical protein RLY86_323 [Pseudomonadota bacterium]|jgi:hypothetical protein
MHTTPFTDDFHVALAAVAYPELGEVAWAAGRAFVARWHRGVGTGAEAGPPAWAVVEPWMWWPGMARLIRVERIGAGLHLAMAGPVARILAELADGADGDRPGVRLDWPVDPLPPRRKAVLGGVVQAAGTARPVLTMAAGLAIIALPLADGAVAAVFRDGP